MRGWGYRWARRGYRRLGPRTRWRPRGDPATAPRTLSATTPRVAPASSGPRGPSGLYVKCDGVDGWPLDLHLVPVGLGGAEHRADSVDVHAVVPQRDLRAGLERHEVELLQRARRVVPRAVPRQPPGAVARPRAEGAEDDGEPDEGEDDDGRREVEVAALPGVDDAVSTALATRPGLGLGIRDERERASQRERPVGLRHPTLTTREVPPRKNHQTRRR